MSHSDCRIRVLPEAVIARIAAGEVIERPASVVKELTENALDAGARHIYVEIADGGREMIRIADDGVGMSAADLELCVLAHATSKLADADELMTLQTLGFRGEALPSIAAVSKFSITSRARVAANESPNNEASAWRVEIAGGYPEHPQPRPAAGSYGATVEARNLFYNLPARAKFLKGAASEASACADTLLRLALTRPDVGFALKQDRHEIFSVQPESIAALPAARLAGHAAPALPPEMFFRRARAVLGRSNSAGLLEVTCGDDRNMPSGNGYRLYGLISPPAITRPNRGAIYLSVNGRPVKDRALTSALLEAYRHLLPARRYPIAALYLELPPLDVDINVHPTKAEVRFRLPGLVYTIFHHAVRRACGLLPETETLPDAQKSALSPNAIITNDRRSVHSATRSSPPASARASSLPVGARASCPPFDLWPRAQPTSSSYSRPASAPPVSNAQSARATEKSSLVHHNTGETAKIARASSVIITPETNKTIESEANNYKVIEPVTTPPRAKHLAPPFRVLGQAGGSYIVIEDDCGIKILDQHAIHERVLFEELLRSSSHHARGETQGLLLAETLELTPAQAAIFAQDQSASETLKNLGFDIEPFGPRAIVVRATPAILKSASAARLVSDVLDALAAPDEALSGRKAFDSSCYREKAAYIIACKGAIKAGERLTLEQMTALVIEYRQHVGDGACTCPHGRPAAVELSWDELERLVKRS